MFSGAEFRRPSLSLAKVEFQRRPTIVCETNIPLHLLLKFCIQTAYDASPWWIADDASVTIPRFPLPLSNLSKGPLQQKIGALTLNRYAFSLLFFLLPILLPLAVLLVPLKPHYEGTVIDHLGFSLVTMGITGAIMGANTLFWMENFFGELFPWRWTLMAAMGPATAAFHFAASLPGGGVLPYGVDVSMLFVVAAVGVWGCIVAPPAVRRRMDWCSHLWVGMGILVFSMLVTHLLLLIESANARGAHVAYVLIMILPVLFTRLTTDIQEAVPYTTQEFAMQCQGILTFVFSLATYCLLIFLSKVVPLWQLYLIFETVDVLSTLFVGPVWELWWKVGYLKTNKFQQSIFGWAQNPMKPKAVVMKYYTKAIAAVAFPVILSVLAESDNQQVFKMTSSDMLDAGKMAEIGACMVGEVVLSISWLVFLYIIMKTRCCQEDFNDLVIQFSKMFSVVQLEGVLATLLVFLIKAKPGNSEFLD
ncbi:unnamed protein product [Ostreobium quekettii]|uniref:Uncharacterized protein n=1 Tax=Ostreobium quekettii TaxID=121088 RepID=A0A8S1IUT5_9CHLO|nr:unnamed protein product [Ostreobium quekettii]